MLSQALSYERSNVPSLTGFIVWMQTDDLEIKRQIDSASDQIRVMTVHGAKGLEAPIVILPDTGRRDITVKDEIVRMQGVPIWKAAAADMPAPLRDTIDGMKDAQFQERLRLLYVAMTRAEKWLIVAAAGDLSKDGSSWYQIAQTAMGHANAVPVGSDGTLRFAEGDWDGLAQVDRIKKSVEKPLLDPVFSTPAPIYALQQPTLSPSDLGGAKALPGDAGEGKESAMLYGTLVHDLLEKLAPIAEAERAAVAAQLISANTSEMAEQTMQEAVQVLSTPALAHIFAHDTLAEVPITAQIRQSRLHGVIDRLIITANTVTAVDFKTNRTVPNSVEQCPDGILRQMGAYAQMLGQIYPDHEIRTAILWTSASRLMELPHNIVTSALECSPYLDAEDMRS